MIRISPMSIQPLKYPDRMPTPPPMIIATRVAANPTTSEIRPPCMSSLSMSMPPSSQPSQCALDGGAYTAQVCWVMLYGEMYGAMIDSTTKKTMIARPTTAALRSRSTVRKKPVRVDGWPPVSTASCGSCRGRVTGRSSGPGGSR